MNDLKGQVVVITGASSGFGKGAALRFAEEGADLVLAARRKKLLKEVAGECKERGPRALAVECDVSEQDDVDALAKRAIEEFGRFDIWVNDAGVAAYGEFDKVPMAEHEQVIKTNLLGTMYGSHAAMKHFYERGEGTLINISSFLGEASAPYHASYVASKHGIRGLGTSLRQELEAKNITDIHVCTVMPTSHDTPFFEHAANHTGKPVAPTPPVYDPKRTIETIVSLAADPQDEVIVGPYAKAGSALSKIVRGPMERMAKKIHQRHFGQKESARDRSGTLFKPMLSGRDVRGGWLEEKSGNTAAKIAAAAAIPVAFAVLGLIRRRSNGSRKSREPAA